MIIRAFDRTSRRTLLYHRRCVGNIKNITMTGIMGGSEHTLQMMTSGMLMVKTAN